MNKKLAVALLLIFSLCSALLFFRQKQPTMDLPTRSTTESPTPLQYASFLIFTNGTKRDFSDPKYHFKSDAAFISDSNPALIQVAKPGISWGEFFSTLPAPFKITEDCLFTVTGQQFCAQGTATLKFYRNGEKVTKLLGQSIINGDRLLVSYGSETEDEIEQQMSEIPFPTEDSLPRM